MINRRGLITGLISFVAAPAIVRVTSIMPVKVMEPYIQTGFTPCPNPPNYSLWSRYISYYARLEALKTSEMWDKLDAIYLFDAPTEELARKNLKEIP